MAEEETSTEEAPAEKKSGNMLMVIIIVVLVLIIVIGGIVAVLLMGDDEEVDAVSSTPQEKVEKTTKKKRRSSLDTETQRLLSDIGVMYPLDSFTVNLKSDAGRRYLKVTMSLELEGEELSSELDAKVAVLRDRIIRILTSKTLEEISSKKGKNKVETQIMDVLNAMISDGQIKGIYFTEFVIQ